MKNLVPEVRLIIACDKLDNLRSMLKDYSKVGEELWQRFSGAREGSIWYYRSMIQAFELTGNCPVLDELQTTLARLEAVCE